MGNGPSDDVGRPEPPEQRTPAVPEPHREAVTPAKVREAGAGACAACGAAASEAAQAAAQLRAENARLSEALASARARLEGAVAPRCGPFLRQTRRGPTGGTAPAGPDPGPRAATRARGLPAAQAAAAGSGARAAHARRRQRAHPHDRGAAIVGAAAEQQPGAAGYARAGAQAGSGLPVGQPAAGARRAAPPAAAGHHRRAHKNAALAGRRGRGRGWPGAAAALAHLHGRRHVQQLQPRARHASADPAHQARRSRGQHSTRHARRASRWPTRLWLRVLRSRH
jgi:hypothetical protein